MNVMDVARHIGLVVRNGEVSGTIDQEKVLRALDQLSEHDPANVELFNAVAERVHRSRSAGVEVHEAGSTLVRDRDLATTQLRYRSEMADLFTDLAIDVGLRHQRDLVAVA